MEIKVSRFRHPHPYLILERTEEGLLIVLLWLRLDVFFGRRS